MAQLSIRTSTKIKEELSRKEWKLVSPSTIRSDQYVPSRRKFDTLSSNQVYENRHIALMSFRLFFTNLQGNVYHLIETLIQEHSSSFTLIKNYITSILIEKDVFRLVTSVEQRNNSESP